MFREVAAWHLACELGWVDLVPMTTTRTVRSLTTGNEVRASVQVVWPLFKVAAVIQTDETACSEAGQWRVALFDAIANNPDRSATNWGWVDHLDGHPKLIDHGNAFDLDPGSRPGSFVDLMAGKEIPPEHLDSVRAFAAAEDTSRLAQVIGVDAAGSAFERARTICNDGIIRL